MSTTRRGLVRGALGGRCAYCGEVRPLSVDHVHPRCMGGGNEPINLLPACQGCNLTKGSMSLDAFRSLIDQMRKPGVRHSHHFRRRFPDWDRRFHFERVGFDREVFAASVETSLAAKASKKRRAPKAGSLGRLRTRPASAPPTMNVIERECRRLAATRP